MEIIDCYEHGRSWCVLLEVFHSLFSPLLRDTLSEGQKCRKFVAMASVLHSDSQQ
jgi:hypothetical protein